MHVTVFALKTVASHYARLPKPKVFREINFNAFRVALGLWPVPCFLRRPERAVLCERLQRTLSELYTRTSCSFFTQCAQRSRACVQAASRISARISGEKYVGIWRYLFDFFDISFNSRIFFIVTSNVLTVA